MNDIIIPIGFASPPVNHNNMLTDYGELRYCLRSIEKHLKKVGNIYLIGTNMPSWGKDMFQIICADKEGKQYKEWNIYNKIKVACSIEAVSNDFLFMNDDHYLLTDFDADFFPYFYEKDIKHYYNSRISTYQITRHNTGEVLGHDAKFFDVHSPIRYNKTLFDKVTKFNWSREYGYCIKSLYCNSNNIEGAECEDLKIPCVVSDDWISKMFHGKQFFSTSDNCWDENGALINMMDELYPVKSKYEK